MQLRLAVSQLQLLTSSEVELMETILRDTGLHRVALLKLLTSSEVELMETRIKWGWVPI